MTTSGASDHGRDWIERLTPSLRRFARALVVGHDRASRGDELAQVAARWLRTSPGPDVAKAHLYGRIVLANRTRPTPPVPAPDAIRPGRGIAQDIDRLPLDQREVLLLVVLEGFSYDETAAILGIPRGSVLARLVRARDALTGTGKARGIGHLRVVK